jgi:hypothetical protein
LKGNYEALLFELRREPAKFEGWKQRGGLQTVIS